jgi:gliding motility-associated lipoprotein GldH
VRAALSCLLGLSILAGCADHVVHQADVAIPNGVWDRSFKPEFSFEITDTISHHDIFLDIRHTGEYPYSDLFLFIDMEGPGGRQLRDTVECRLADPTGRWYGRGTGFIFADRFQAHVLYRLRNRFPTSGRYNIRLEQAMRTEQLPGIIDVGVSIERSRTQ